MKKELSAFFLDDEDSELKISHYSSKKSSRRPSKEQCKSRQSSKSRSDHVNITSPDPEDFESEREIASHALEKPRRSRGSPTKSQGKQSCSHILYLVEYSKI